MAKNIAKSVRMCDVVYNYVDSYDGNGFNEKFENLVLYAFQSELDLKNRLEYANMTLSKINEEINQKRNILAKLKRVEQSVDNMILRDNL